MNYYNIKHFENDKNFKRIHKNVYGKVIQIKLYKIFFVEIKGNS
jgi:hypothetical protein